jgi:hypothetical protein
MLGAEIPIAILAPAFAIFLSGMVALLAWMVREMSRISTQLSVMDERSVDVERRLDHLERYRSLSAQGR